MEAHFWQGEKVRLRAMREEDADDWLAEATDDEGNRHLDYGIPLPKSPSAAVAFVHEWMDFKNASERIMFSIETLDGELVGGINVHSMDIKNGTFQTGTRIARRFRGKGYADEAKRIVLRYAFHERRFQKYNVRCLETNEAMIRHARRLGCKEEGRIRRSVFTDGRYLDECLFGLTREEFDEAEGRRG